MEARTVAVAQHEERYGSESLEGGERASGPMAAGDVEAGCEVAAAGEKGGGEGEVEGGGGGDGEGGVEAKAMEVAAEEDDEFAWRAGQESDSSDDDDGPIDDRVEGAIENVNVQRDAMTNEQLALDMAQRSCARQETHTASELARLQEENAPQLTKMAAYEMAKALSSEAQQAADEAVAKHGKAGAHDELAHARQTQADSMRMAMELQDTFEVSRVRKSCLYQLPPLLF